MNRALIAEVLKCDSGHLRYFVLFVLPERVIYLCKISAR
jgi:hypothetical protein